MGDSGSLKAVSFHSKLYIMYQRLIMFSSVLCLSCGVAFSQLYYVNLPPGHNKLVTTDERIPGIVGSPYFSDNWSKSEITLLNGKVINDLFLRYNVHSGEIHFQTDNKTYILGSPDSVVSIDMYDKRFVYLPYQEKRSAQKKDYFEVFSSDGMVQILIRHSRDVVKSNYNVALNTGEKDDRMVPKQTFYIRKENSNVEVDKRGDNVYELLKDRSGELKEFVKRNKISFTQGEDLKQLVEYYNSLN